MLDLQGHHVHPGSVCSRESLVSQGFQKALTKDVGYFVQRSWLLFSPKEEATSAHSVVNKTYITKFQWKRKGSLVLSYVLVANAVFQSIFHTFLWRFTQPSSAALVESVSVPELLILSSCYCVQGTRTQPLICVGWSVHYWVACAINKVFFFKFHFRSSLLSTHIYLALRRLLKFCLTLTR